MTTRAPRTEPPSTGEVSPKIRVVTAGHRRGPHAIVFPGGVRKTVSRHVSLA